MRLTLPFRNRTAQVPSVFMQLFPRLVYNLGLLLLVSSTVVAQQGQATDELLAEQDFALLYEKAIEMGNPGRGAVLFASPTQACLSCHQVGQAGGQVGPDLTKIATQRKPIEIVDSLWNPQSVVAKEYQAIAVLLADGLVLRGHLVSETDQEIVLREHSSNQQRRILQEDIEAVQEVGSLMPTGLMNSLSEQDQLDLISFVSDLGKFEQVGLEAIDALFAHSHAHHPESFEMDRRPLEPEAWPSWESHVNRDRVYDFYRKQARHYRKANPRPSLLVEFPGLDGGGYGHWGNQSEPVWADGRWSKSNLGSLQSGVFHGEGISIARGMCVRLTPGESGISVCFDPDTLSYPRVWSGGFVTFTDFRHGFMHGVKQDGPTMALPAEHTSAVRDLSQSDGGYEFLGLYRDGERVFFSYRIDSKIYLDEPVVQDGVFRRIVMPIDQHPARTALSGGRSQWDQRILTAGQLGSGKPYAVDTISLPIENPWNSLLYCGGHDFLSDGSVMICTMQGDVWHGTGIDEDLEKIVWKRYASGLHQPLGLIVQDDQVYVQGRDQITRLHDLNEDDEADFYESYSRALGTSKSGHDFTCGLQRDSSGRFYTASGLQGVMRISSDGRSAEVLATGLRNSDGIGITPDGLVTVPSSEGDWMPASMIAALRPDGPILNRFKVDRSGEESSSPSPAFFGRPGTNLKQPPEIPMLYLPRGLDNSSGGQVYVSSERWGPVQGQMVHLSFGGGRAFLLLKDEFDGWIQGAAVPIAGELLSGAHRGRFHPIDGQLYVSGMAGWGSYTTADGCLQRIRYTGGNQTQLPVSFHLHENGIRLSFSEPIDSEQASDPHSHFVQAWNYRFSGAYGSPEYSHRQLGLRGHDVMPIQSATVLDQGHGLFLEIRDLQRVNQLHLLVNTGQHADHDLFMTVNHLDEPFSEFPTYETYKKVELPHPMLADLKRPMTTKRNPFGKPIQNAREETMQAAKNLMFDRQHFEVEAGEAIRLTFKNPDAVPHNWALLTPGSLREVGELCNRLISDPDAVANHYIPKTDKVVAFTDVVEPYSEQTIYFHAPKEPGRYPYLCTFPGHWMVMNGWMEVVEK